MYHCRYPSITNQDSFLDQIVIRGPTLLTLQKIFRSVYTQVPCGQISPPTIFMQCIVYSAVVVRAAQINMYHPVSRDIWRPRKLALQGKMATGTEYTMYKISVVELSTLFSWVCKTYRLYLAPIFNQNHEFFIVALSTGFSVLSLSLLYSFNYPYVIAQLDLSMYRVNKSDCTQVYLRQLQLCLHVGMEPLPHTLQHEIQFAKLLMCTNEKYVSCKDCFGNALQNISQDVY